MNKKVINPGDVVQYFDTLFSKEKNKVVKVPKQGIWDGEKVILNDKEKTTVRSLDPLTLYDGVYYPYIPIEKKTIEVVIFEKTNNFPILWKDWKHIKLEDNDIISNGYIEPWTNGDDNSGGDHFHLKITRKRLESDKEATDRTRKEEEYNTYHKKRRYQNYLNLKKEFENGNT
jgi:hypothetical protein